MKNKPSATRANIGFHGTHADSLEHGKLLLEKSNSYSGCGCLWFASDMLVAAEYGDNPITHVYSALLPQASELICYDDAQKTEYKAKAKLQRILHKHKLYLSDFSGHQSGLRALELISEATDGHSDAWQYIDSNARKELNYAGLFGFWKHEATNNGAIIYAIWNEDVVRNTHKFATVYLADHVDNTRELR